MFNTFVIHIIYELINSYLQNVVGYLFTNVVADSDVLTDQKINKKIRFVATLVLTDVYNLNVCRYRLLYFWCLYIKTFNLNV